MSNRKKAKKQVNDESYRAATQSQAAAIEKLARKQNPAFYSARKKMEEARAKRDVGTQKKATDDALFAALGVEGFARLDDPQLVPLLSVRCGRACKENDVRFFIRLGRVLSESRPFEPGRLSDFLVSGWRGDKERPGLCFFTDEALTELCRRLFGNPRLTLDVVRKTRQRLGLKKAGPPSITKVEEINGQVVVS